MDKIELKNVEDFNLTHILECGQCFRWKKENDGSYTGVIKAGVMNVSSNDGKDICFTYELSGDANQIIENYFDLKRDYKKIKDIISVEDKNMIEAIKYGYGIRILKQDPWEMLISYIISAANNIPRISKTIENISKEYGRKIKFNNKEYYLFPTPKELSEASIEDFRRLNLGFRDKYVYGAVQDVVSGTVDLEKINQLKYKEAKKELMKIKGVGSKVADCILLFSMNKIEAFPIDTWIKKVMTELYSTQNSLKDIEKCATERFGEYAGIAQQYLFYYMREKDKAK